MPQSNNEVDLSTVTDVVLHLHYTALDGGDGFRGVVQEFNKALPKSGIKIFSALNDFAASPPTAVDPNPLTPWQAFLAPAVAPANQTLTLSLSPSRFPVWTRGKTITVTSLTVLAVAWPPGKFTLKSPLYTGTKPMNPVSVPTEGNLSVSAADAFAPNTPLGKPWSFELQQEGAPVGRSLTSNDIGDVLLLVSYDVSIA